MMANEEEGWRAIAQRLASRHLYTRMHDYQWRCLRFLLFREACPQYGIRGGINGMNMGLGKTLPMLCLILLDRMQSPSFLATLPDAAKGLRIEEPASRLAEAVPPSKSTTLVVSGIAPLDQWEVAISKHFAPGTFKWLRLDSRTLPRELDLLRRGGHYDLCLISTSFLSNVACRTRSPAYFIFQMMWHRLIIDEIDDARNCRTQRFRALERICANRRWGMTGSPINIHISDIASAFAILHFKHPVFRELYRSRGPRGDLEFNADVGKLHDLQLNIEFWSHVVSIFVLSRATPGNSPTEPLSPHEEDPLGFRLCQLGIPLNDPRWFRLMQNPEIPWELSTTDPSTRYWRINVCKTESERRAALGITDSTDVHSMAWMTGARAAVRFCILAAQPAEQLRALQSQEADIMSVLDQWAPAGMVQHSRSWWLWLPQHRQEFEKAANDYIQRLRRNHDIFTILASTLQSAAKPPRDPNAEMWEGVPGAEQMLESLKPRLPAPAPRGAEAMVVFERTLAPDNTTRLISRALERFLWTKELQRSTVGSGVVSAEQRLQLDKTRRDILSCMTYLQEVYLHPDLARHNPANRLLNTFLVDAAPEARHYYETEWPLPQEWQPWLKSFHQREEEEDEHESESDVEEEEEEDEDDKAPARHKKRKRDAPASDAWLQQQYREWILNAHRRFVSPKMEMVQEYMASSVFEDEKLVIHSRFATGLQIMGRFIQERLGFAVTYYMGSMNERQRRESLERFRSQPPSQCKVLLAATKSVCRGLELTRANHIIQLDTWWNPVVNIQTAERIRRDPQTRIPYRNIFMIADSFERIIHYTSSGHGSEAFRTTGNWAALYRQILVSTSKENGPLVDVLSVMSQSPAIETVTADRLFETTTTETPYAKYRQDEVSVKWRAVVSRRHARKTIIVDQEEAAEEEEEVEMPLTKVTSAAAAATAAAAAPRWLIEKPSLLNIDRPSGSSNDPPGKLRREALKALGRTFT